jgi:hypothetical protein
VAIAAVIASATMKLLVIIAVVWLLCGAANTYMVDQQHEAGFRDLASGPIGMFSQLQKRLAAN